MCVCDTQPYLCKYFDVCVQFCLTCCSEGEEQARTDYASHFAEEGEEEETAQEKRLRLAKQYLKQLEEQGHFLPPSCVTLLD